jgi:hypothetical protein
MGGGEPEVRPYSLSVQGLHQGCVGKASSPEPSCHVNGDHPLPGPGPGQVPPVGAWSEGRVEVDLHALSLKGRVTQAPGAAEDLAEAGEPCLPIGGENGESKVDPAAPANSPLGFEGEALGAEEGGGRVHAEGPDPGRYLPVCGQLVPEASPTAPYLHLAFLEGEAEAAGDLALPLQDEGRPPLGC